MIGCYVVFFVLFVALAVAFKSWFCCMRERVNSYSACGIGVVMWFVMLLNSDTCMISKVAHLSSTNVILIISACKSTINVA